MNMPHTRSVRVPLKFEDRVVGDAFVEVKDGELHLEAVLMEGATIKELFSEQVNFSIDGKDVKDEKPNDHTTPLSEVFDFPKLFKTLFGTVGPFTFSDHDVKFEASESTGYVVEKHNCEDHSVPFEEELQKLLNRYSSEAPSGTPDFILAEYLINSLKAYNEAVSRRAEWRGEPVDLHPEGSDLEDQSDQVRFEKLAPPSVEREGYHESVRSYVEDMVGGPVTFSKTHKHYDVIDVPVEAPPAIVINFNAHGLDPVEIKKMVDIFNASNTLRHYGI